MVVREREISDVRRLVAYGCQLGFQGLSCRGDSLRDGAAAGREVAIGNYADVPHQRAFRVDDEITRDDEVTWWYFAFFESERSYHHAFDDAAVDYIEAEGGWRFRRGL